MRALGLDRAMAATADLPPLAQRLDVVRRKISDSEHIRARRAELDIRGDANRP